VTEEKKPGAEDVPVENILHITDELVAQVDRTKKLVIVMIIAIVIAIPVTWHASALVSNSSVSFRLVGVVTIAIALVFLAIGVRQWMVLSKWTGRYKQFKELQKKVDEKLDFESEKSGN
jgi:uncharacterized membrane protein YbhN (UPF0104 family)